MEEAKAAKLKEDMIQDAEERKRISE